MKYDWLREYEEMELRPMEMTSEERAKVLADALGKANVEKGQKRTKKSGSRMLRWTAVLAAVLAACILTAGASGIFDARELLYWIFGARNELEQIEGLELMGCPIGLSQTQGGYTVSLLGVVGDRSSCYLVFDVNAPEGTILNNQYGYGFQSAELWSENRDGGSFGYYCVGLEDDDPEDHSARFMVSYEQEDVIRGKNYVLCLKGFTQYVDDHSGDGIGDNEKILADETWQFTFKMDYQDQAVHISIPRNVSEAPEEGLSKLRKVYISPLSIRLTYGRGLSEMDREGEDKNSPEIILHFRDGSALTVADHLISGSRSSGAGYINRSYQFSEPINLSELLSLEIDGMDFFVEP